MLSSVWALRFDRGFPEFVFRVLCVHGSVLVVGVVVVFRFPISQVIFGFSRSLLTSVGITISKSRSHLASILSFVGCEDGWSVWFLWWSIRCLGWTVVCQCTRCSMSLRRCSRLVCLESLQYFPFMVLLAVISCHLGEGCGSVLVLRHFIVMRVLFLSVADR